MLSSRAVSQIAAGGRHCSQSGNMIHLRPQTSRLGIGAI